MNIKELQERYKALQDDANALFNNTVPRCLDLCDELAEARDGEDFITDHEALTDYFVYDRDGNEVHAVLYFIDNNNLHFYDVENDKHLDPQRFEFLTLANKLSILEYINNF